MKREIPFANPKSRKTQDRYLSGSPLACNYPRKQLDLAIFLL